MHLYVHVPFCRRRCSYCDFSIAVRKQIPAEQYVDAVLAELQLLHPSTGALSTLYLGGGTPSLLPVSAFERLRSGLETRLPLAPDAEVTLEANPEDVTDETARAWRAMGINRISLGAQSFDDRVLVWMHRPHDAAAIPRAVAALRRAGIENLSLDLIFALPPELTRDWDHDLAQALSLLPTHLSLYGLTVEQRTPLARWISRGATTAPDDERYAAEYLRAHARLTDAGYGFYEVSNAARPGAESRHNSAYWTGRPYTGLGPAAHSFDGRARRWNEAAWELYRARVVAGELPVASEEVLSEVQRELESVYLGLRTRDGIPLTALDRPRPPVTAGVQQGWLVEQNGRLRCTPEGWLRLDALVAALTAARAPS